MDVVIRPILSERPRRPPVDIDEMQADALVAILAAAIDDAEAIRRPAEEIAVPAIGHQGPRRGRAPGRRDPELCRLRKPGPDPCHPLPVRRYARGVELRHP